LKDRVNRAEKTLKKNLNWAVNALSFKFNPPTSMQSLDGEGLNCKIIPDGDSY
jgi:hypothetical protein